jgi:hypothetical protein
MFRRLTNFVRSKNEKINRISTIEKFLESSYKSPKVNLGQIQANLNNQKASIDNLSEVEFQVFSQWGDDGIIQYLVNKLDIPNKTFIEFGVENYVEANTRFLIFNNNWTGHVLDGSQDNITYIKNDIVSWGWELYSTCAFITKENINELLSQVDLGREPGILSVDIDGNDYWVWEAIDCIDPVIVITEYNSVFGKNTNWTVPYDPSFVRRDKHPSTLYYGASLTAMVSLGKKKGYEFIGCNSKGNNAYFIRKDKIGPFKVKTVEEGYVLSKFREAHIDGQWVTGLERIRRIEGTDIVDLENGQITRIQASAVSYK